MADDYTQFDYLLNAFELASQASNPAEHGYAEKRRNLFAYVRELEARNRRRTLSVRVEDSNADA